MSYMSELAITLDDLREGRPLDAEQVGMVRQYADYLRSPVSDTEYEWLATRDAGMDTADRWADPDTNDGIEWADESE